MTKELDEQLVKDFPLLYADRHKPMNVTAMCWGFPNDGWEPLIRKLSKKLEALIKKESHPEQFRASQVKEKFGTLRFYMTQSTDAMSKLISKAASESARTCEDCGKRGKIRKGGWFVTLCDKCHAKSQKK